MEQTRRSRPAPSGKGEAERRKVGGRAAGKSKPGAAASVHASPLAEEPAFSPATSETGISVQASKETTPYTGKPDYPHEVSMDNEQVIDVSPEIEKAKTPPTRCEVDSIIRKRVYASLAVGLAPLPLLDMAALSTIQGEMIYQLCKAYNVPFKAEWGKKAVGCMLGGITPVLLTPGIANVLRYVPVVGQGLGLAGGCLAFAAATYAVGQVFARHLASGGTLLTCDFNNMSAEIKNGFEKSKDTVKGWVKRSDKKNEAEEAPAAG